MDENVLKNRMILIVDDKVDNIMRITRILDKYSMEYATCTSARHAIVSYINNPRYIFDIGLIDIIMPEMDGNELAEYISKTDKSFPLIALSSIDTKVNNIVGEFNITLTKPYTENQLVKSIYTILKSNWKDSPQDYINRTGRRTSLSDSPSSITAMCSDDKMNKDTYSVAVNDNVNIQILIVEDNYYNRLTITKLLNALGYYNLVVVNSGKSAITKIKRNKGIKLTIDETTGKFTGKSIYDVILMDIVMPNMNGITTSIKITKLFAKRNLRPKIVAVTANVMPGDREHCLNEGKMDDYRSKPILKESLAEALTKI